MIATAGKQAAPAKAAAPVLPFTALAREHTEPMFDVTNTLGASTVNVGTLEVPAFGFLRHIVLLVTISGATGGTPALAADAPWNIFSELTLTDVNGQPIFGPYTGWDAYLSHLLGGYAFDSDPKHSAFYSAPDANGNTQFLLRIPVEITQRDALGALANMNASSTYRLRVGLAPSSTYYSTAPTTLPSVRVQAYVECWTPGEGGAQPLGLGTTQVWSKEIKNVSAGSQTFRLSRVGNSIRNLVLVTRDNTGARIGTSLPDPLQVMLDGRLLFTIPRGLLTHYQAERYGYTGTQIPTGVYVFDMTHDFDGHPGGELRDQWLHTTSATRLELQGSFGSAGTLTILTNDVLAAAGVGVASGE